MTRMSTFETSVTQSVLKREAFINASVDSLRLPVPP